MAVVPSAPRRKRPRLVLTAAPESTPSRDVQPLGVYLDRSAVVPPASDGHHAVAVAGSVVSAASSERVRVQSLLESDHALIGELEATDEQVLSMHMPAWTNRRTASKRGETEAD